MLLSSRLSNWFQYSNFRGIPHPNWGFCFPDENNDRHPIGQRNFKNIIKPKEEFVSIDLVQKVVSTFFNIKISDLKVKRKNKGYVLPRQIAMYLSRKLTSASLLEIGDKFGGKDHSTVLHSIKKVEEKMSKRSLLKKWLKICVVELNPNRYSMKWVVAPDERKT